MANPKTLNDWKKAVGRFEASGLTQVEFCKREGIGLWSFRKWRKRMAELEGREPGFIEVTPVPVQKVPQRAATSLVVELAGGIVLRFEGLSQ